MKMNYAGDQAIDLPAFLYIMTIQVFHKFFYIFYVNYY